MLLTHLPVLVLLGAVAAEMNPTDSKVTSPTALMNSSSPDSSWTNASDATTSTLSATAGTPATDAWTPSCNETTELTTTAEPFSADGQNESSTTGAAASAEMSLPTTTNPCPAASAAPTAGHTPDTSSSITHPYTPSEPMTHTSDSLASNNTDNMTASTMMSHTSSEPMSNASSEPMTYTSGGPMSHTWSEPMSDASSEPMTHTSSEPMTHTSDSLVSNNTDNMTASTMMSQMSSELMSNATSEPMSHTSSEPMSHTPSEPMTHTSSEPMTHTSDSLVSNNTDKMTASTMMSHTSNEPMSDASSEPMTHTSGELMSNATSEPMSHTSSEPMSHTSDEPMIQTSSEPMSISTESTLMTHSANSMSTSSHTSITAVPSYNESDTTVMTGTTEQMDSTSTAPTQSGSIAPTPPASPNSPSAAPALSSTVSTNAPPTAGSSPPTPASSSLPPSSSPGSSAIPATATSVTAETSGASATPSPSSVASTPSPDTTVAPPQPTEPSKSTSSTQANTPSPSLVCPWVPCPSQSVCLNSTCQCLSGSFLLDGQCQSGQVFPGELHLNLAFKSEMYNRSSSEFQQTAATISAALREVLKDQPGYNRSEIVQLQPGSVRATVNNIFRNSNETQADVEKLIYEATQNSEGFLAGAEFRGTSLCDAVVPPCDVSTTMCTSPNGVALCTCMEGYVSDVYSTTSCRACPSGQQAVGSSCKACSFGYAGFNCNDPSLLAVVIISCVLGGILLILVLAFLAYYCRFCCKRKADYNSSPYSSGDLNQSWPTGVTPIPRANTNWNSGAPIELTEGGSTNTLVEKKPQSNGLSASYDLNPETMKTFKGKNTSRYSYLVEGHENPYFLPGDERKE